MKLKTKKNICWCGSGKAFIECHGKEGHPATAWVQKGHPLPPASLIKSEADLEALRVSGRLTTKILDAVEALIQPGTTTEAINTLVHNMTIENGGIPATLNFHGYPKSCCVSINEVVCHGIPSDRQLEEGDIVNVDITSIVEGYYSDASRMYIVGEASEKAKDIVKTAKECLEVGLSAVKPYLPVNVIGEAIEKYANDRGYSVVRSFGGHGIGKKFHEDPFIYHYKYSQPDMIMVPGMVFTIEPMINEGTYKCRILEDDWTAVTTDGKLSAQWEHTLVVTEEGYEIIA